MSAFRRVLLVAPPSSSYLGAVRPPTGLGYLAESLREAGIAYAVVDMRDNGRWRSLERAIRSFQPDLIGVSLVSFEYRRSYELIRAIKAFRPGAAIVAGGHHVTALKEDVLRECPDVDFGVVGDGERPLVALCRGETSLDQVPGLLFRRDADVVAGPSPELVADLDSLPFPRYLGFPRSYAREIALITSRGCPYRCIFCPNSLTAKRFRARSATHVVDEIEHWYRRGIRQFNVDDDNFTLDRARVEQICDQIEARGLEGLFIRCANGIRADRVDRTLLARMKDVGFKEVAFGADGGNNRVLRDIIHKDETIEDIERALRDACDLGMGVKLFIIVGSPGETPEDVEDSIALAQRYPITWLHLNNPIPYPGTPLYDWVRAHKRFVVPPEEYLNGITETDATPVFDTVELPLEARKELLARCRRIERAVKRRAVERMFANLPVVGALAGRLFASPLGQRMFFRNLALRGVIDRVWYAMMMRG